MLKYHIKYYRPVLVDFSVRVVGVVSVVLGAVAGVSGEVVVVGEYGSDVVEAVDTAQTKNKVMNTNAI